MKRRMLSQWRVQRACRSRFGRAVCATFGDRAGAVMMEYVILAVLIAAAAVVAVAMFGRTIVGMFSVAAKGATGDHTGAKTEQDATREKTKGDIDKSKDYHDKMHE